MGLEDGGPSEQEVQGYLSDTEHLGHLLGELQADYALASQLTGKNEFSRGVSYDINETNEHLIKPRARRKIWFLTLEEEDPRGNYGFDTNFDGDSVSITGKQNKDIRYSLSVSDEDPEKAQNLINWIDREREETHYQRQLTGVDPNNEALDMIKSLRVQMLLEAADELTAEQIRSLAKKHSGGKSDSSLPSDLVGWVERRYGTLKKPDFEDTFSNLREDIRRAAGPPDVIYL